MFSLIDPYVSSPTLTSALVPLGVLWAPALSSDGLFQASGGRLARLGGLSLRGSCATCRWAARSGSTQRCASGVTVGSPLGVGLWTFSFFYDLTSPPYHSRGWFPSTGKGRTRRERARPKGRWRGGQEAQGRGAD